MPALENPLNEAASFDAIPVRLSFDLGEISLTLAELRALQPGQAIRLGHPIASAVRIRANGALIGEGELVEIDGQLGISVRQLFAASSACAA
ncbi:Yop protein translocation protein Q [compost metagenome]